MSAESAAELAAMNRAVRAALIRHALLGQDICIERDGEIVFLPPAETLAELKYVPGEVLPLP
jgi:hypothetical protein